MSLQCLRMIECTLLVSTSSEHSINPGKYAVTLCVTGSSPTREVSGRAVLSANRGGSEPIAKRAPGRAVVLTDVITQSRAVVLSEQHSPVGKDAGLTAHIEQFWCTLQQRCARIVGKRLSFSKCPANLVGALCTSYDSTTNPARGPDYFAFLYNMYWQIIVWSISLRESHSCFQHPLPRTIQPAR